MPARAGSCIVLIIEDDVASRETFKELVEVAGHEVYVAAEGAAGIALAREHPPDVAFVDLSLPLMDGYEVGRRLREQHGRLFRLIAVSGHEDPAGTASAGFDELMVKPVDPERLLGLISS